MSRLNVRIMLALAAATALMSTAYGAPQRTIAPPPMTFFRAANFLPFLLDEQQMVIDLKAIKTEKQAAAYQARLATYWPTLVQHIQMMNQAFPEAGEARLRNIRSPQTIEAEKIANQIEKLQPALTNQTARVGILYRPLRPAFRELHHLQHGAISAGAGR